MRRAVRLLPLALIAAAAAPAHAVLRHPTGVNVDSQGATTVFITYGALSAQLPAEALWCGELIPAAPDIGFRCDPSTIFGSLPARYDRSRLSAGGTVFTDIMSVPPSVARRAYQAAGEGQVSSFFYVRRFVSTAGGPDEYVFVTCRMAGGGARVPLSLVDVRVSFAVEDPVLAVPRGAAPPPLRAEISYTGTGRLQGRWEVVLPGDEAPEERDLLTEATLPPVERSLQRRYSQIERFNVFLPPAGRATLPGPDPGRLPSEIEGLHLILLRIEATDDKEADSNLALAGAGSGTVHAGAVAGFPMPVLRYFVGSAGTDPVPSGPPATLRLIAPQPDAALPADGPLVFSWSEPEGAHAFYRLEVAGTDGEVRFSAVTRRGTATYGAPPWIAQRLPDGRGRWRVQAIGQEARTLSGTEWREFTLRTGDAPGAAGQGAEPGP